MKLQRTTWVLLILALGLGSFVYFYEIQGREKREALQQTQKQIFHFEEKQVQSLIIEKQEQTLEFVRTKNQETTWQMKQPDDVPANDASVAFLLNLLTKETSDRSFIIPANQSKEYGLDQPLAKVKVQLENKETHEINLGRPGFQEQFIYAQTDPPIQKNQEIKVILVPKDFQYAVKRELSEWKEKEEADKKLDSKKQ